MLLLFLYMQSFRAYGFKSISSGAACLSDLMGVFLQCLQGLGLKSLKSTSQSAIANSYFCKEMAIEASCAGLLSNFVASFLPRKLQAILLAFILSFISVLSLPVQAITITNTANVSSDLGNYNSSVAIITVLPPTPSTLIVYQYAPSAPGAVALPVAVAEYSPSGLLTGPFSPLVQPTNLVGARIAVPAVLDLLPVSVIKGGETLFIGLNDADHNTSSVVVETVVVELVSGTGDQVLIRLTETGADTGVFTGYVQTSLAASAIDDAVLTVASEQTISVSYTDNIDNTDTSTLNVLVDPLGVVLNSATGALIDGAEVTLIDTATGLPASVFGDDGVSTYPATVISGGSVSDSSGSVYNFQTGAFRFPFIAPGNYRLDIVTPSGFNAPSTVSTTQLQTLPGAPFAIVNGSRGEVFVVNPGPPLRIDIPIDPDNGGLFLSKRAAKERVGMGEFVQYKIQVTNTGLSNFTGVQLRDILPEGFRYQAGSVRFGGTVLAEPDISADGRTLLFNLGALAATTTTELKYVVSVTAGALLGNAVNQVSGTASGGVVSNVAEATVLVEDDFMRSESIIMGRVMLDGCEAPEAKKGQVNLSLNTQTQQGSVAHTLELGVDAVAVNDMVLEVRLPRALEYVSGSASLDGKAIRDPEIFGGQLRFKLGSIDAGTHSKLKFQSKSTGIVFGEFQIRALALFKTEVGMAQSTPVADNLIRDYSRILRPRFDSLSAELKTRDMAELNMLIDDLKGHAISKVYIIGHTDEQKIHARSSSLYANNEELSFARASSVASHLKANLNLTGQQVEIIGKGASKPVQYNKKIGQHLLSQAEKLALNRRVEVLIEMEDTENRFLIAKANSGKQVVSTQGAHNVASKAGLGLGNTGVAGVRLYTESGRYVDTDEQGQYHFEGLKPGSHIVQLDIDSLPKDLEVHACEQNTRIAGTPYSRFVDTQSGSLWRADFYVRKKLAKASMHNVGLQLESHRDGKKIVYKVLLKSRFEMLQQEKLFFELPLGLKFVRNSSQLNGAKLKNPQLNGSNLVFDLSNEDLNNENTLVFEANILAAEEGEYIASALLKFKSAHGRAYRTDRVDNTLVRQYVNQKKKIFVANYQGFDTELDSAASKKLEGVVDYLQGKKIRSIIINGYANEITRSKSAGVKIFDSNEVLASQRAAFVGEYFKTNLRLMPEQIQVAGYSALDLPGEQGRFVEVLAVIANGDVEQTVSIAEADSGFKASTFQIIEAVTVNDEVVVEKPQLEADKKVGFLSITEGIRIANPVGSVRVRMDARLKPVLSVDADVVPNHRIGVKLLDKSSGQAVYNYIGVNFGKPGMHNITIKGMGPFGNARFEQSISYVRTGEIAEIKIVEVGGNVADGKTPVKVKVVLLDKQGEAINASAELLLTDGDLKPYVENAGEQNKELLHELKQAQQLIKVNAQGEILFEPATTSGVHVATLEYNNASIDIKTYVKPVYRDWIMVGLAESTLGYNKLADNMQSLNAADMEENFYHEGRLAFYSKGKIKGKYLLTLAYDSEREQEDVNNGLFGSIDPDKYYSLYGDNTQVAYDAPSTEKLYLKLENDKFYALFGDYETGLTVTELSRYSRSLTGFKGEYQGERLSAQVFAADSNHAFLKDEFPGDGTSGLYRLSNQNIVLNSEKITIETRDRFRSQLVLETKSLQRYVDYNFDPVAGTVYFKEPIYSRDQNFNPVYIVVDYETNSSKESSITAGGRVALSLDSKGSEVGVTMIQGDTPGAESELLGTDLSYKAGKNTEIKLEAAQTSNTVAGGDISGSAYLAEITHQGKKIDGKVYAREQQEAFGLGQQKGSENASRKVGIEAGYAVTETLTINSEIYRDENLATNASREMASVNAGVKQERYSAKVGLRHARDKFSNGDQFDSSLVTGAATHNFMDKRLTAKANAELAVGDDENSDYPARVSAGLDYALTGNTSVFAEQELTYGEFEDSQNTRVGLKSSPWSGAQINTNIEQQVSEYSPRRFANFGLTQTWQVSQALSLDAGLDRSVTLNEPSAPAPVSFNLNMPPASGAVRDDFTAVSAGATYKQENWSLMTRLEHRGGDLEDKSGVLMGFYRQQGAGLGLSSELTYFGTKQANGAKTVEADLEFSVAYRPIDSRWIILNKALLTEFQTDDVLTDVITRKFVNNFNSNYLFNRENQLALAHGFKHVKDNFDGQSYSGTTQFLGAEYRHDFNARWDMGLQTSLLASEVGENRQYSYGASVGYNVAHNMWLSLGYNAMGFDDDDFSAAAYSSKGTYIKFRIAFDHLATRDALAWWEKR